MRYGELFVEKSKVDSEKIEVVIVKGAKYFSFTMNQSENTGMDVIRMIGNIAGSVELTDNELAITMQYIYN